MMKLFRLLLPMITLAVLLFSCRSGDAATEERVYLAYLNFDSPAIANPTISLVDKQYFSKGFWNVLHPGNFQGLQPSSFIRTRRLKGSLI